MSAASVPAEFEAEQEIRLAVVLYGGVSLAIYINGVTQELFELVRATAPDAAGTNLLHKDTDLTEVGRVYRRLGRLLSSDNLSLAQLKAQQPEPPVRSRFVVDVISGTSAGGINGIVLAKALANQQEVKTLQTLWEDEGDIWGLINDRLSFVDGRKNLQDRGVKLNPPEALLNSQRLYIKVLDALGQMDEVPAASASAYVDELDLFVTTTDLDGLPQPIRLADEVVLESRYKNVFHFVYAKPEASGEARNDFDKSNNPFMAFAARCTSSFPFAFDPMRLEDIKPVDPYRGDATRFDADVKRWRAFFKTYPLQNFPQRSFGDGGYLNNKPFSYATDTLLRRRANVRTDRKLIYVEPSPEDLRGPSSGDKPDAISNAVKALVTLPGYETIRQDIERVDERNRLIERVRRITDGIERDVEVGTKVGLVRSKSGKGDVYGSKDLAYMIGIKGVAYGGYHRLKVAAVTDELAALIARVAHVEEGSEVFQAIRSLVGAWRSRTYADFLKPGGPALSENRFLVDLDLSYRLRRINFLRTKIEELYGLELAQLQHKVEPIDLNQALTEALASPQFDINAFRTELRTVKATLNDTLVRLRRLGRDLRAGKKEGSRLPALVEAANPCDRLAIIQRIRTSEERRAEANRLLSDPAIATRFDAIAGDLIAAMRPAATQAAAACLQALEDGHLSPSMSVARAWLRHYYDHYDDYDMITFPITYGTEVGESVIVEIVRVSPVDAKSLVDEAQPGEPGKLAGTTFFHFGGFLDRRWRQNDMLWGRLDGAERIIKTMLPNRPQEAAQLVTEAHAAILKEELERTTDDDFYHTLVLKLQRRLRQGTPAPDIVKEYPPDSERIVRTTARATTVIGKILDGITHRRDLPGHRAAVWFARVGTLLWGLVEVSVPHSFARLVFGHWLTLLYLFAAFLIVGGIVFNIAPVQKLGLATLGATLAVNLAVVLTGELLRDRGQWLRRSLMALSAVLIVLIILGGIELTQLLERLRAAMAGFGHGGPR
jgi:patatin-related protein